jgi:hypothetical protein
MKPENVLIGVPFEAVKLKCDHQDCGRKFCLLALFEETNDYTDVIRHGYMLQEGNQKSKLYCPYCGRILKYD